MDGESNRPGSKSGAGSMPAPFFIHVYVWAFMVMLSVAPILGPLSGRGVHSSSFWPFIIVVLTQWSFSIVQRLCSTEELSYWDGLLAAACSVATRGYLVSFVRAMWLLLAVVILSILFAACHDGRIAERHAGLRYGRLIVWLHKQRLRASSG